MGATIVSNKVNLSRMLIAAMIKSRFFIFKYESIKYIIFAK